MSKRVGRIQQSLQPSFVRVSELGLAVLCVETPQLLLVNAFLEGHQMERLHTGSFTYWSLSSAAGVCHPS